MSQPLEQQLSNLTNALNAQTQAINLLVQAIGQLIMEQATETAPDEPPMFDLSGKPIVIR